MDDLCPICFESHNGGGPAMPPMPAAPVKQIWRWPCGHGVHYACIAQSRASLLTINGPCYVCRHACHVGALDNFKRAVPFMHLNRLLDQVPDEPLREEPVVHIPRIAALCCPRLAGPFEPNGNFEALPTDRRMSYMGLLATGHTWTCMTCHTELVWPEVPGWPPDWPHECIQHGRACYVLDLLPRDTPVPRQVWRIGRYFSCCNVERDDVPLPVQHFYPGAPPPDAPLPWSTSSPMIMLQNWHEGAHGQRVVVDGPTPVPRTPSARDWSRVMSQAMGVDLEWTREQIEMRPRMMDHAMGVEIIDLEQQEANQPEQEEAYLEMLDDDGNIDSAMLDDDPDSSVSVSTDSSLSPRTRLAQRRALDHILRQPVLVPGEMPDVSDPVHVLAETAEERLIMEADGENYHEERRIMEAMAQRWNTVEEQLALEALLEGYTDE